MVKRGESVTSDGKPVAFHDFKRTDFPFRIRLIDADTDEVLMEHIVRGPGAVSIPGYGDEGRHVNSELTFPNGHQFIHAWDGTDDARIVPPPRF